MKDNLDERMKVIEGHASSVAKQMDELNTFINEISALSTYSERGMTELKIQPILIELVNRLNNIRGSINVILEESNTEAKEENE